MRTRGRNVSDKPSPAYAPAVFVSEPETKAAKATKAKLVEAMARLFAGKRIKVRAFGPPSKVGRVFWKPANFQPLPTPKSSHFRLPAPLPNPLPT